MSLKFNSHFVIIGGMPFETAGRALGPYRIRTVAQQAGFATSIIDFSWVLSTEQSDKILDYVIGTNTLAVGVSYTWEPYRKSSHAQSPITVITDYLRRRGLDLEIILGCANVARVEPEVISMVDWIINGFAEIALPAVLNHISGVDRSLKYDRRLLSGCPVNFVDGNRDYLVNDMTQLQTIFESQDLFQSHQPLTIETCRGCVFSCAYCSYQFTGKKDYHYIRPIDNLADELIRNYDLFGTTRYAIADDTFNDSLEKISRLQQAVDKAKLPNFEFACYIRPELLVTKPKMIPALVNLGLRAAHFGIESLNDKSRRTMGRSSTIAKIQDAVRELKSKSPNYIGTLGSFIVGLPYDSQDQLREHSQYLNSDANDWLDSWTFGPLSLNNQSMNSRPGLKFTPGQDRGGSAIEKFPQRYGYTIPDQKDSIYANWRNQHMTFEQATSLAWQFNIDGSKKMKFGGWFVSAGWYLGISENHMQTPGSLMSAGAPATLFDKGSNACTQRAKYWLQYIQGSKAQ